MRCAGLTIAIASFLLGVHFGHAEIDLPKLARESRRCVILLVTRDTNGQDSKIGTGFFISKDGLIATNWHVVSGSSEIHAKMENGARFAIKGLAAKDEKNDLAVLQADAKDIEFLPLFSGIVEPGIPVAVIGSPLGLEGTVSNGIVSAKREMGDFGEVLQITAPISHGSSGSPVLNEKGEVIGVASAFIAKGQNLNIAVPSEKLSVLLLRSVFEKANFGSIQQKPNANEFLKTGENIRTDPDFQSALKAFGEADNPRALKYLNEVKKRYPKDAQVLFFLGQAYSKVRFYKEAVAYYRASIAQEPEWPGTWGELGFCLFMEHDYFGAEAALKQAIALKPDSEVDWRRLALVRLSIKRFADAIDAAENATKFDEANSITWSVLADCYSAVGKTKESADARRTARTLEASERSVVASGASDSTNNSKRITNGTPSETFSVTGIEKGDFLNVRTGPGMSFPTSIKLQNGHRGLRIESRPAMNGNTEWVKVSMKEGVGWIRSKYLRREAQ